MHRADAQVRARPLLISPELLKPGTKDINAFREDDNEDFDDFDIDGDAPIKLTVKTVCFASMYVGCTHLELAYLGPRCRCRRGCTGGFGAFHRKRRGYLSV